MQPIYKGNGKDRKDPASYRGICLTCATTKLFEGLINNRLYPLITEKGLVTPFQSSAMDDAEERNYQNDTKCVEGVASAFRI
jgi:hypothetical protein